MIRPKEVYGFLKRAGSPLRFWVGLIVPYILLFNMGPMASGIIQREMKQLMRFLIAIILNVSELGCHKSAPA